jgi:hypothetical protein
MHPHAHTLEDMATGKVQREVGDFCEKNAGVLIICIMILV